MTDKIMVILTFCYVIATIFICIYNVKSVKAAKEQTDATNKQTRELIRQFNDSQRPFVIVHFESIRNGLFCLVIENMGPVTATNIKIRINEEFINNLNTNLDSDSTTDLSCLKEQPLTLVSHQRLFYKLGSVVDFDKISSVPLVIDISYSEKYKDHIETDLKNTGQSLLYNSDLEDIACSLKKLQEQNNQFYTDFIDKLDIIHNT